MPTDHRSLWDKYPHFKIQAPELYAKYKEQLKKTLAEERKRYDNIPSTCYYGKQHEDRKRHIQKRLEIKSALQLPHDHPDYIQAFNYIIRQNEIAKRYRQNNRDKINAYQLKYRMKHGDRVRQYMREYKKKKYAEFKVVREEFFKQNPDLRPRRGRPPIHDQNPCINPIALSSPSGNAPETKGTALPVRPVAVQKSALSALISSKKLKKFKK
jgi:hypothetical protein